MIQRISHTTIYVLDQDAALKFYRDQMGFEVRTDVTMDSGFRWLTVGPKTQPDMELVLMKVAEGPMCDAATARAFVRVRTATDSVRRVMVPSPNWPKMLSPQQRAVPSPISAQL